MSDCALQYYLNVKRWISDVEFYKIEIAFLMRLLNDYAVSLSAPPYMNQVKLASRQLSRVEGDIHEISELLDNHQARLDLVTKGIVEEDAIALAQEQLQLEYAENILSTDYRETKHAVFLLIERAIAYKTTIKR